MRSCLINSTFEIKYICEIWPRQWERTQYDWLGYNVFSRNLFNDGKHSVRLLIFSSLFWYIGQRMSSATCPLWFWHIAFILEKLFDYLMVVNVCCRHCRHAMPLTLSFALSLHAPYINIIKINREEGKNNKQTRKYIKWNKWWKKTTPLLFGSGSGSFIVLLFFHFSYLIFGKRI